jgi:hypothetical protein
MKSTWFKLFFCGVLLIAVLGCVRWAVATVRRSHRRAAA